MVAFLVPVAQTDPPDVLVSGRHQGQQRVHLLRVVDGKQVEADRPTVALSLRPRLGGRHQTVTEVVATKGRDAQSWGGG